MFYSHEILTSRKYGVATVWLVATLGAKSSTRKVTRKAILDVDLKKACETIIEPEAPMALRLQSNLLYGVSRVYSKKWEYLLTDVQLAQSNLRALFKVARHNEIDPEAGKARAEQLVMGDDPAFHIDMALPALDFDFIELRDSQHSSQSMLSFRGRSGSLNSQNASILELDLPSSSNGGTGAYQLPLNDPFSGSSAQKPPGVGAFNDEDEHVVYNDEDLDFGFDVNGELLEIPAKERRSLAGQGRLGSNLAASGRVRKEHEDAAIGRGALARIDNDGDTMMNYRDEDMAFLPDAEPFPMMTGGLGGSDRPLHHPNHDQDHVMSEEPSSTITADAPLKRSRIKKVKALAYDYTTCLTNRDLIEWRDGYLEKMLSNQAIKDDSKYKYQAKQKAFQYVFGSGLAGVGGFIGTSDLVGPLTMFSGEDLRATICGRSALSPGKHALDDAAQPGSSPSKRMRSDEVARGSGDDEIVFKDNEGNLHDQSVELARDAPSALADYPSSAMPWNMSASLHSHQRGASSKAGHGSDRLLGLAGARRLTSASPLVGRGSALPGDLDRFSQQMGGDDGDDMVLYGRIDSLQAPSFDLGGGMPSSSKHSRAASHINDEEFELFGAAAGVDTQTAGTSQWVKSALDRESNNFFEYVKNSIEEKRGDELHGLGEDVETSVGFDELFVPQKNSAVVAAQAFYHILTLATKSRVWVEQGRPFGEIKIGVW